MDDDAAVNRTYTQKKVSLYNIISTSRGNDTCLSNSFRRLGTLYKNAGQLDSAFLYFTRSLKLAAKINDTLSMGSSCNQIGLLYSELDNWHAAKKYFEEALFHYQNYGSYRGLGDALHNLSTACFNLRQDSICLSLCQQSILNRRKSGDTSRLGFNYDLLAHESYSKKNYKSSQQFLNNAFTFLNPIDHPAQISSSYILTGKLQLINNHADSAESCFLRAYKISSSAFYRKWAALSLWHLADLLKDKAPLRAANYLHDYCAVKDTLTRLNALVTTIDATTRYETEKKDMELINQHQLTQNSQQLNYALIAMVSLLLITILVLMRNSSQRKKIERKESELQNANAMLKGQDEERERIARELHDRVGSMLSTVKLHFTSMEEQVGQLVKVQHRSYEKAIELLDETYEEVRRISHDLDTGLLGRFGLRTAMLQLAQVIESTNKLKILYIDNNLQPEIYKPFETDLYRITQELLSNTIKYAKAREISIQLSRNNGNLVYSYEDDGIGFSKEQLRESKGIGYKNIEARVNKMKGQWHLDTSPGNGLNLIIELPISEHTNNNS